MEDVKKRIDELRAALEEHNRRYHVEDNPVISDYEYDRLFAELVELEEAHPAYRSDHSPTARVGGAPAERFEKVTHELPLESLNDVFSEDELFAFDKRVRELIRMLIEAPRDLLVDRVHPQR